MGDPKEAYRVLAPEAESTTEDPLLGRLVQDKFRIHSLLARGGMGRVYRAVQEPLGRTCAIKVVNAGFGAVDPEFQRRFYLEASVLSKLTHPNTVTVYDYGKTDDDMFYMAMELLEGRTLHRAIREARAFTESRALHIVRQVCRSLREAHALGVVHRDLKPANVFLVKHGDESDFVKVLDFGLVKHLNEKPEEQLTQTGLFMGSPKYMAPEQIEGGQVDARTDLYAIGVLLYEMLTGKVPFERATSVATLMAHVNDPVPSMFDLNRGLHPDLVAITMRCLEKDPAQRFESMDALLTALRVFDGAGQSGPFERRDSMASQRIALEPLPPEPTVIEPAVSTIVAREASLAPTATGSSRVTLAALLLASVIVGGGIGLITFRYTQKAKGAAAQPTVMMPVPSVVASVHTPASPSSLPVPAATLPPDPIGISPEALQPVGAGASNGRARPRRPGATGSATVSTQPSAKPPEGFKEVPY